MSEYATICVSFIVIIVTWACKILNWVWFKPRKLEKQLRKQGLQGSSYKFLHGDLKDTFRMRSEAMQNPIPFTNDYASRALRFLHQHVEKYGKDSFTWIGPIPVINITEPDLIREVFTRMYEFQKPNPSPLIRLLGPGLIGYEGKKWEIHRRIINPAFHMEKLKRMLPALYASITEMIDNWEQMVSELGSFEIDVWPYLTSLSADAISRAAFGSSYEEGRKIFELLKEQTELTIRLIQSIYVPGWKYVPTKTNKRMKETNVQIQNLLKRVIDRRKKAMEAGGATKDDLLGILLESNLKETQIHSHNKKSNLAMSNQEIIDECKLFYFAGQETSSVLLVWTMILLSKHQDWQMRARDEVLATFGTNQPDYDGLNRLKIVTMILYEVLRLYPAVLTINRQAYDRDTELGSLIVPKGAMVALNILQVHHDPKLWGDDVKEFKPERFSEGILKATKGNLSYFPFGGGPRICIGQNFATIEAKMALCMILQCFSFELSPSYTHAPSPGLTLQPQHGAPLILHRL